MPELSVVPSVEVGQVWRMKDADPWDPPRYEVVATLPGWVRIQMLAGGTYWLGPRGVKLQTFHDAYLRDVAFEQEQKKTEAREAGQRG